VITLQQQKFVRVLFDEFHSESWTVSETRAKEIQPDRPAYSSYQQAADALARLDFTIHRNVDRPLTAIDTNVLVLLHPCESKWEKTTSGNSPKLSPGEIDAIVAFVEQGGGLLVVSEYEHDKYGDNLNDLLARFGLEIENTTVFDAQHCVGNNPAWFLADVKNGEPCLMHQVEQACFYQAGSCRANGGAAIALRSSTQAGLIGIVQHGKGRVALITDSLLFGDEYFDEYSHRQLWLNLLYWIAGPAFARTASKAPLSKAAQSAAWSSLKGAINALRVLQNPDGTVVPDKHDEARHVAQAAAGAIQSLAPAFPHEADYLNQVVLDLDAWVAGGFAKPDFTKSLEKFNPQKHRRHNIEHLWVMPMYTPNSSSDWRFEAIIFRGPWPDWLAELERTQYQNDRIVPGHFVDFTAGYASECAVLFPETVQVAGKGTNQFATIFCDREAKRYQRIVSKAAKITRLELHPQLECFLNSLPMILDTYALWDLIHDKSHSVGELPFDPFMIRQRAPFWMYGLEELRVDLRAFCEATRLAREGFPFAHYVRYAILFDRIYRFPITGPRVRNYDGLGGQLLFAYLHQHDVLLWHDNRLSVRWDALDAGMDGLRQELLNLYKFGSDASKMNFWLSAHDLVSKYVPPNVASKWKKDSRAITDESDPKRWIDLVHPDEFPLGNFHTNLEKKMATA
jgi:Family of unknown function (DUF6421)/Domain of unknown function (DUF4350)